MRYILITPARNEEAFLEETIRSVTRQTLLPERWVIVSDGSTDRTDEIIRDHAARHAWVLYLRLPEHADRHFAAKARAFAAGYAAVGTILHDVVGNLDADLSFDPEIMRFLMGRFAEDPTLGVAGVPFVEPSGESYDYRFTNIEHVSGACQLFRRECFEAVGGYKPMEGGGIDWLAVTTARMMGWRTRTFTEKSVLHHRKTGTGQSGKLGALYRQGAKDFHLGNHPVWQLFRSFYQMKNRPYGIGGLALLAGYFGCPLRGCRRTIPPEVVRFGRREQMARLAAAFGIGRRHLSPPPL
ncbi:MAG TPA: glycosyltransferase [Acidobacteriota bacterium]|nr:glycosyltransferase [Acidobacteriota bacterium]